MTDIEDRLRSTMANDTTGRVHQDRWDSIVVDTAQRSSRRQRAARGTFAVVLLLVTATATQLITSISQNAETLRTESGDGGFDLSPLSMPGWLLLAISIAFAVWHVIRGQRLDRPPMSSSIEGTARLVGLIAVGACLTAPLIAYADYVGNVRQVASRYEAIDGLEILSSETNLSPFNGGTGSLVTLTVVPMGTTAEAPDTETVERVLTEIGFRRAADDRLQNERLDEWPLDVAEIERTADGSTFAIDISKSTGLLRQWMPLVTLASTYGLALSSLLFLGTRLGRFLGAAIMAAAGFQVGLVIRGLSRADQLLESYRDAFGPFDFDLFAQQSTASPQDREVYRSVNSVAADVYPFGSYSTLLFVVAWFIGTLLVFWNERMRWFMCTVGLVAAIAGAAWFSPINDVVLNILE